MTNVSKKALPAKEFDAIFSQLNLLVSRMDKKSSNDFFSDLLGPEEQVMLIKRLAAVVMFIEGNSSYRVQQLLQLSPSTAEKIRLDFESGRYDRLTRVVTKNLQDYEKFWETLEVILRAGLPPRGRGRWKSVFENLKS